MQTELSFYADRAPPCLMQSSCHAVSNSLFFFVGTTKKVFVITFAFSSAIDKDFDVSISKNSFFHFTDPNFNLLYAISNSLSFFRCACAMVGERIATNIANVREGCKFSFTIVLGIDHTVNLLPSSDPGVVGKTTILDKKWDYDLSAIRSSCEEFEESLVEDFERPSTVWSWFVGLSEFGSDDFSSRDSTNQLILISC